MKKRLLVTMMLVLIVCLVAAVALTGCSDKKDEKEDINAHLKDNAAYNAVMDKFKEIAESGEAMELINEITTSSDVPYEDKTYTVTSVINQHIYYDGEKMKIDQTMSAISNMPESKPVNVSTTAYYYVADDTSYMVTVASDGEIIKVVMPSIDAMMQALQIKMDVPTANQVKYEYDEESDSIYTETNASVMGMETNVKVYLKVVDDQLVSHQISKTKVQDQNGQMQETTAYTDMVYLSYGKDVPAFDIPQDVIDAPVQNESQPQ